MSQINQKSISGITSITTPAGVDDVFSIHKNDTSEVFRIDQSGNQNILGIITASQFKGDGSQLTGIDATKIITGNTQVQTIDTGSDGHVKVITEGSEKVRITSSGKVGIGTNNPSQLIEVQDRSVGTLIGLSVGTQYGNASFGGYNNYPAIMNNIGVPLLYCDTNNDRTILFGDTVGFGTTCAIRVNNAERLRITSQGQLKLSGNNTGNHMLSFGSNVGGLTIDDVGNQHTALEVQHGSNKFYNVCSSNNSNYISSYGTGNLVFEHTGTAGGSRTRMQLLANGNVSVANTIDASQMKLASTTSAVRNTGVSTATGTLIYNSTTNSLQVYSQDAWVSFSGKQITVGGGTISNNVNRSGYVVHTFTSPGTFTTDGPLEGVEIMVVGAGGGGGGHRYGSGGGAGGVIMRPASPAYPLSSPAPVVVGSGGAGAPGNGTGSSGSNSTFGSGPMQVVGKGGGGGTSYDGPVYPGRPGGSGVGATSRPPSSGGSATQPGTHGAGTDYGNRGGNYTMPGNGWAPTGGGGAGAAGEDTPTSYNGGGNGGNGVQLSISGSATYYAGGGASGIYNNLTGPGNHQGIGGNGGGGSSSNSVPGSPGHSAPGDGAANSGGGGCGAHGQNYGPGQNATSTGKSGGSGIVIVAYPLTQSGGDIVVS